MASTVSWVVKVKIKAGQLEAFKALMDEMVESTKAEEGTLAYEWFIDEASENVHIYERYADSAAVLVHGASFGEKFAERFMGAIDVTGFDIYGEPSDDVKGAFEAMGPAYFGSWGGFAR